MSEQPKGFEGKPKSPSPEQKSEMSIEQELMTLAAWSIAGKGKNIDQFVENFNKKHSTVEQVDPKKILEENISHEADPTSVFAILSPTYIDYKNNQVIKKDYIFHIPTKTLLEISEDDLDEYFRKSEQEREKWEESRRRRCIS